MFAEENKALVRRYVEEFVDRGNFDLSEEIFAPNFVRYDAGPDQVSRVEDLKHFFAMLHSGFPGFQSTIEDLLSEEDKVALRFTFHARRDAGLGGAGDPTLWLREDEFACQEAGRARRFGASRDNRA